MATLSVAGREFEIGTLKPETVRVYPEPIGADYSLLTGVNRDGEVRSILTRAAGKQWGATRVPIQISSASLTKLTDKCFRPGWSYDALVIVLRGLIGLDELSVLLARTPREGNFFSGWEWDAPGGVQEVGELPREVAKREFDEETGLVPYWVGGNFPEWNQYASGAYSEVQSLSLALVTGQPTRLVEGAKEWIAVPLGRFLQWAHCQNQLKEPSRWQGSEFCPVDGKVYAIVRAFCSDIRW